MVKRRKVIPIRTATNTALAPIKTGFDDVAIVITPGLPGAR
jgi:hypothetical protein